MKKLYTRATRNWLEIGHLLTLIHDSKYSLELIKYCYKLYEHWYVLILFYDLVDLYLQKRVLNLKIFKKKLEKNYVEKKRFKNYFKSNNLWTQRSYKSFIFILFKNILNSFNKVKHFYQKKIGLRVQY